MHWISDNCDRRVADPPCCVPKFSLIAGHRDSQGSQAADGYLARYESKRSSRNASRRPEERVRATAEHSSTCARAFETAISILIIHIATSALESLPLKRGTAASLTLSGLYAARGAAAGRAEAAATWSSGLLGEDSRK